MPSISVLAEAAQLVRAGAKAQPHPGTTKGGRTVIDVGIDDGTTASAGCPKRRL